MVIAVPHHPRRSQAVQGCPLFVCRLVGGRFHRSQHGFLPVFLVVGGRFHHSHPRRSHRSRHFFFLPSRHSVGAIFATLLLVFKSSVFAVKMCSGGFFLTSCSKFACSLLAVPFRWGVVFAASTTLGVRVPVYMLVFPPTIPLNPSRSLTKKVLIVA